MTHNLPGKLKQDSYADCLLHKFVHGRKLRQVWPVDLEMPPKTDCKTGGKKVKSLTLAPSERGGFVNFHMGEGMTYEANGVTYVT